MSIDGMNQKSDMGDEGQRNKIVNDSENKSTIGRVKDKHLDSKENRVEPNEHKAGSNNSISYDSKRKKIVNKNVLPRPKIAKCESSLKNDTRFEQEDSLMPDRKDETGLAMSNDGMTRKNNVGKVGYVEPLSNSGCKNSADDGKDESKSCFYDDGAAKTHKYQMLYKNPHFPKN